MAAGEHAAPRQQRLQEFRGLHQRNAFIRQSLGHRPDKRIGIARAQRQQQLGQPPIRLDAAENLLVLHLPGHDGAGDAGALKSFDQPRQLAQRHPVNGGSAMALDLRRGFFLYGGDDDLVSLSARGIEHQQREAAVAGDKAEFAGSRHGFSPR